MFPYRAAPNLRKIHPDKNIYHNWIVHSETLPNDSGRFIGNGDIFISFRWEHLWIADAYFNLNLIITTAKKRAR